MNIRTKILSAVCIASAAVFFSCGESDVIHSQNEQTLVTLSWWGNDARNEYTLEAVEEFGKLHPEIKVKCSYSEWSGYEARSRVQMISDTEADVMQVNFAWLSEYSPDGKGYYDLEKLSDIIDLSNYSEDMLEYGRKNGILNAVPIAMNTETIYINQSVLDKYNLDVPLTWDDLFVCAETLRKDGIYLLSGPSKSVWLYAITYAEQLSGKKFTDGDNFSFTADELEIMIEFYDRLVKEEVMPQVEYFRKIDLDNKVYAGTVAWVSDAVNYLGTLSNKGENIIPAEYTALPGIESGTGWYAKPATMYAVSKNTECPKEAGLLLDFLCNSMEMAQLQGVEKGIPLSKSAREHLDEIGMLSGIQYEASKLMENNPHMSKMHPLMENSRIIEDYFAVCNEVIFDKADSKEASEILFEQITEICKNL
ncbi:MAG: carbohydrate ABC transporter substrate-binding protein [Ruminococcus sp.]|nr:carbohydrate ABC transporter substrate-binding protein [Ruminococcus sp.]